MLLEVAVGIVAALLVVAGVVVIAGPALPRALRSLAAWRSAHPEPARRPPLATGRESAAATTNPTTLRALAAASRLYSLLRASGEEALAAELRTAARRVRTDEGEGLVALAGVLRPLREVTLEGDAAPRYARLVTELREAVKDRSEQLELLRFR